jgi:hypothetical protein
MRGSRPQSISLDPLGDSFQPHSACRPYPAICVIFKTIWPGGRPMLHRHNYMGDSLTINDHWRHLVDRMGHCAGLIDKRPFVSDWAS